MLRAFVTGRMRTQPVRHIYRGAREPGRGANDEGLALAPQPRGSPATVLAGLFQGYRTPLKRYNAARSRGEIGRYLLEAWPRPDRSVAADVLLQ